jgi:2-polyprenyl-6-methoxyphenol hydroxylase-like FAD-dependent oxidoreductase
MNNSWVGHHVLVIGGSLAGLFAARVLADFFDKVTILDRDVFPVRPDHRKGVPQSYHAHALLPTAFPILERLFPGILNDLCKDGAATASNVVPFSIVSSKGLLPLPKCPGEIITFSRHLLEWHVRDRVSRLPGVEIITNVEGTGLLATQDHTSVIGLLVQERGKEGHINTLFADLVVDASGRHSQASEWMVELGYEATQVETINSDMTYASRFYAKPKQFAADWHSLVVNEGHPHGHAGFILAVDNERWHVALVGTAGNVPPIDEEGFLKWAQDLPDPSLYEVLRIAQPLTTIRGFAIPQNHWRHFERMHRWPKGFIVTGDAVCAFNPIFGQGMTVSAMDAMTFQQCLQEQQRSPRTHFEQHLQHQIAKVIAPVWFLTTTEDLRWPKVKLRGARPNPCLPLLRSYLDLVLFSAIIDPKIAMAYFNVYVLATPPSSLVRPRMVSRILVAATKRAVKRLVRRKEDSVFALSPEVLSSLRDRPATSMIDA